MRTTTILICGALAGACTEATSVPPDAAPSTSHASAVVERIRRDFPELLPERRAGGEAVALPEKADEPFALEGQVRVGLVGAAPVVAARDGEFAVYPEALGVSTTMVQRAEPGAIEDYVVFERAPPRSEIAYRVELGDDIQGLRLVERTLELLDGSGTPRIRMRPPFLMDRANTRRDARVTVEGCAVDTDPSPPWDRDVTPPGARACTIVVAWDADADSYPAVLDPAWTDAARMTTERSNHTAVLLDSGRVLVCGGFSFTRKTLETCEYFTRGKNGAPPGSWAVAPRMATARFDHTATKLADGRVLIAGGTTNGTADLASAEVFVPEIRSGTKLLAAARFVAGQPMTSARSLHTSTLLPSGDVVVAGGTSVPFVFPPFFVGSTGSTAAEIFHPSTGAWTQGPDLGRQRGARAVTLPSGNVLIAGGFDASIFAMPVPLRAAFRFGPGGAIATPSLAVARHGHAMAPIEGGALVVGGTTSNGGTRVTERFDEATGQWVPAANAIIERTGLAMAPLGGRRVLVVGGSIGLGTEIGDPSRLRHGEPMRWRHTTGFTMTDLRDGRFLVAGGALIDEPNPPPAPPAPPPAPPLRTVSVDNAELSPCLGPAVSGYCFDRGLSHDPVEPRLAVGLAHTCLLDDRGGVRCVGANESGQLGVGTSGTSQFPRDVVLPTVVQLAAGAQHTCAITAGNEVYCWGANTSGQAGVPGVGVQPGSVLLPTRVDVPGTGTLESISAGLAHTCVARVGSGVYCWGRNAEGQLGQLSFADNVPVPVKVHQSDGLTSVAAGSAHTCALGAGGLPSCWGLNRSQQAAPGDASWYVMGPQLAVYRSATKLVARGQQTCILDGGGIVCWGTGIMPSLPGGPRTLYRLTRRGDLVPLSGAEDLALTGDANGCVLLRDGDERFTLCWGDDTFGRLGDGILHATEQPFFVDDRYPVVGLGMPARLEGGWMHTCAIAESGQVACWGESTQFRMGDVSAQSPPQCLVCACDTGSCDRAMTVPMAVWQ